MNILKMAAMAATLAIAVVPAWAQSYPERLVKIVVPFPASGSSDLLARLIGPRLSEIWNVPVIVDNRPGASGNIGMDVVAKAAPDGLTLVMTNNVVAVNAPLYPNAPFNVERDFAPLGLIGVTPMVMIVHPSVPAKNLAELTAYAKANPGKLNFGSCGQGTPQHLAVELYRSMAGIDMFHVPYKGCAPAVTDILGGQVQVQVLATTTVQAAPHIQSGALRGIAVTVPRRSPAMPDVPTFEEAGLTGYRLDIWFGLMAPAKTPEPILAKIHADVARIMKEPEVRKRTQEVGIDELLTTRAEHAVTLRDDLAKYAKLIRSLNLAPQN